MPDKWQQWYPHDINAWQASTVIQDLSDTAYRAVHNLLMAQFQSEDGMLPADELQLAKLSRKRADWPAIREEVLDCFERGGPDRIYNSRMYTEWANSRNKQRVFKENMDALNAAKAAKREKLLRESYETRHDADTRVVRDSTRESYETRAMGARQEEKRREEKTEEEINTKAPSSATALPDWILKESWDGFVEMRKKIRKPMTVRAQNLVLGKLAKIRSEGCDANECLDQSTRNCWQDVFPLKQQGVLHGVNQANRGAAVGRVERSESAWDRAAARRGVPAVEPAL